MLCESVVSTEGVYGVRSVCMLMYRAIFHVRLYVVVVVCMLVSVCLSLCTGCLWCECRTVAVGVVR